MLDPTFSKLQPVVSLNHLDLCCKPVRAEVTPDDIISSDIFSDLTQLNQPSVNLLSGETLFSFFYTLISAHYHEQTNLYF